MIFSPALAAEIMPPAAHPLIMQCITDLAQRCHCPVEEIITVAVETTTWPDTALGLPEYGKMYAQTPTPGWRLVLKARGYDYLYTASHTAMQFGGPLSLWAGSMLYLQPVPDDPNLNSDLYQCALLGTNHVKLCSGVADYYPQANGRVLLIRRTSRSSHELLYLRAGEDKAPQRLCGAFGFGGAALHESQDRWAALVRPRIGGDWMVMVSPLGGDAAQRLTLALPEDLRPQGIAWSGDRVMILASRGEETTCLEVLPTEDHPAWRHCNRFDFPGQREYVLNKSQSLNFQQADDPAQPRVDVEMVSFTGTRHRLASLPGLTLRGANRVGANYFLVWGEQEGFHAAYTVNIMSGAVYPTFRGHCREIKPFQYPPIHGPQRIGAH